MRIAILGATSQIARDLIFSFTLGDEHELFLFARSPDKVVAWLASIGWFGRHRVAGFSDFSTQEFDAVINFVGVGDPKQLVEIGSAIFGITLRFDELVLDYLQKYPSCRYIFLSSGTAYGSHFAEPATQHTLASFSLNDITPAEWYGVSKFHAECRHRALPEFAINDIRVFNYFSRSQDISARFLMSDVMRAIMEKTTLKTSPDAIVRDYVHASDFHRLVSVLLAAPANNTPVDCYSLAPIDKPTLLTAMHDRFGLRYEISNSTSALNATGIKPNYYSMNRRAADFGYEPTLTSLVGILLESEAILGASGLSKFSY